MKRLFQITAFLLVAILAAVPALAAPCTMDTHAAGQCACCCSQQMSHMGHGNCPMHSGMNSSGCGGQNCCETSLPKSFAQLNALPSSKSFIALVVLVLPSLEVNQQQADLIHPHSPPLAPSEPIYLLNQVFRI